MDTTERYAYLRRVGQTQTPKEDVAALRRLAKRDGLRLTSNTKRDYMNRPTTTVALVAEDGMTIVRPDEDSEPV